MVITFKINGTIVEVYWLDNDSVEAIKELSKEELVIKLGEYEDYGLYGSLDKDIKSSDEVLNVKTGDIVLLQSNKIVIVSSEHSASYTKLGHINLGKSELIELMEEEEVFISLKTVKK